METMISTSGIDKHYWTNPPLRVPRENKGECDVALASRLPKTAAEIQIMRVNLEQTMGDPYKMSSRSS